MSALEVQEALGKDVALILDGGQSRGGQASTVLDLTCDPARVVRSGAVPLSAIEQILGRRLG
jgi:L-threonylcarbamoyladenylate synthase